MNPAPAARLVSWPRWWRDERASAGQLACTPGAGGGPAPPPPFILFLIQPLLCAEVNRIGAP